MQKNQEKDSKAKKRQELILDFIKKEKTASISQILKEIRRQEKNISRITISRDLKKLVGLNLIQQKGAGRNVFYKLSAEHSILKEIDVQKYFSVEAEERSIREKFNFNIFDQFKRVFAEDEKLELEKLNAIYRKKMKVIPKDAFKKEIERLNIDFSWKSSKIEGNAYSLLETEQLIKNQKEAVGHSREEAIMILNHKKALEYIELNKNDFRTLSLQKIESIHSVLVDDLEITKGIRKILVGITGTKFQPLDNEFQIKEALEKTCLLVNEVEDVFDKAVIVMLLVAYIQPFIDGNKRTSRLCGNAILQAFDCCPLSYRSMKEIEYKKAVLLFYEQNNIFYFKKLFLKQFEFAVNNYFG